MKRSKKEGVDLLDLFVILIIITIVVTTVLAVINNSKINKLMNEIENLNIKIEQMEISEVIEPEESMEAAVDTSAYTVTEKPIVKEETFAVPSRGSSSWSEAPLPSSKEIDALARCVYGEARGCSPEEMKMVVHTVLNRVESDSFQSTIMEVLEAPGQFVGYKKSNPIESDIREVVIQALREQPPVNEYSSFRGDYLYFTGDGEHNWFRRDY